MSSSWFRSRPRKTSEDFVDRVFEQYRKTDETPAARSIVQLLRDPPCHLALSVQLGAKTSPAQRIEAVDDRRPARRRWQTRPCGRRTAR